MIFSNIPKEFALIKRNIQSRQGRFQADKQHYFVLHDILSEKDFQHIRELVFKNKKLFLRNDSSVRQGSAMGGHELRKSPLSKIADIIDSPEFLEKVQSQSGVNAFRVVMDETNNTPDTIDRNMLVGQVFLQPSRTAEFIVLDFIVQPTGAAFPE